MGKVKLSKMSRLWSSIKKCGRLQLGRVSVWGRDLVYRDVEPIMFGMGPWWTRILEAGSDFNAPYCTGSNFGPGLKHIFVKNTRTKCKNCDDTLTASSIYLLCIHFVAQLLYIIEKWRHAMVWWDVTVWWEVLHSHLSLHIFFFKSGFNSWDAWMKQAGLYNAAHFLKM